LQLLSYGADDEWSFGSIFTYWRVAGGYPTIWTWDRTGRHGTLVPDTGRAGWGKPPMGCPVFPLWVGHAHLVLARSTSSFGTVGLGGAVAHKLGELALVDLDSEPRTVAQPSVAAI
jgi:hypothetical protein